jgi:hypothetical protein
VRHDPGGGDVLSFLDEPDRSLGVGIIKVVGDRPQPIKRDVQPCMSRCELR